MNKRWLHAVNQIVTHEETHTGADVEIQGTVNAPMQLKVYGKTEQEVTVQGKNFYPHGEQEYGRPPGTPSCEYIGINITEFIKTRVGKTIKISADFKSSVPNPERFNVYTLGGYRFFDARDLCAEITTEYQRFSAGGKLTFTENNQNGDFCIQSIFCNYGTGVTPSVKNIIIEEVAEDTDLTVPTAYEPFVPNSPSPEYPSEIVSVDTPTVMSCGRNLFDINSISTNSTTKELVITDTEFSFKANMGMGTKNVSCHIFLKTGNYFLSGECTFSDGLMGGFAIYDRENSIFIFNASSSGLNRGFKVLEDKKYELGFYLSYQSQINTKAAFKNIMLYKGTSTYEPYRGSTVTPRWKNLVDISKGIHTGCSVKYIDNGFNLTATATTGYLEVPIKLTSGADYRISFLSTRTGTTGGGYFSVSDKGVLITGDANVTNAVNAISSVATSKYNITKLRFYANFGGNAEDSATFMNVQLEEGTVKTAYEPYREDTVRSLPDGVKDVLHVDAVNKRAWIERNIGVKVFDGSNASWVRYENSIYKGFATQVLDMVKQTRGSGFCSHLQVLKTSHTYGVWLGASSSFVYVVGVEEIAATVAEWNTWLSNNHMTIQYKAVPTTEEIPWSDDLLLHTAQYYTRITTDNPLQPTLEVTAKVLGR